MATDPMIKALQDLIGAIHKYDKALIPSSPLWESVQNRLGTVEDNLKDKEDSFLLTEDEFGERQEHASIAAQHVAYGHMLKVLQDAAGHLFVQGKDEHAKLVRDLAGQVERFKDEKSKQLQVHIDRAMKR